MPALLSEAAGGVESIVALPMIRGLAVVTRGLVVPTRGLVVPMRGLFILSLRLVVVMRGLVIIPSWRLVAPCMRVAHGHRRRARLVLESLRVVACLELAPPTRRRRRAAVAAAIVGSGAYSPDPAAVAAAVAVAALAVVLHPIPGVRSSTVAIFMIATAAVIFAPPTVHIVTAVAATSGHCGGMLVPHSATGWGEMRVKVENSGSELVVFTSVTRVETSLAYASDYVLESN
eukprot:scaffold26806_cov67-Phaeocystis_antarctica.AAC.2